MMGLQEGGYVADYPITPKPVYTWIDDEEFRTIIKPAEDGSEQRNQKWPNSRRRFKLKYRKTDAAPILTFFKSKKGAALSFTFDPNVFLPAVYTVSENITVRFEIDRFKREIPVMDQQNVTVSLIEVL